MFVYLVKKKNLSYNANMTDLWNYLKTTNKPILLYGMGDGADKILTVLNSYGIKISGVFASDTFVRKKIFHGFEVTNYSAAKEKFGEMIVLLCFGSALPDVLDNIKKIASEQELYAPDVAVYGNTLFNLEYAKAHKGELEWVYNNLADQTSKKVFENTVYYKLTGKIEYLFDCETAVSEAYENILSLGEKEIYLDLGAYRGDTVYEFLNFTKGYEKIIAVEPDCKTYKKLSEATAQIKNIENINACVSDIDGERNFCMNGSRGSATGGKDKIRSVTVDSLLEDTAATYIKMDIEGEELSAIRGATRTIKNYKPKMQIAAYHRSEDLFTIPKAVLRANNKYKMFLRHYPCLPSWDMSYFFI